MEQRISYIKKPFAKTSLLSLGFAVGALVMGCIGFGSSIMTGGQAGLSVAAVCFCSFLIAVVSLIYGILSFFEKDKKYILAKISMGISGGLIIIWAVLFIIGLRG